MRKILDRDSNLIRVQLAHSGRCVSVPGRRSATRAKYHLKALGAHCIMNRSSLSVLSFFMAPPSRPYRLSSPSRMLAVLSSHNQPYVGFIRGTTRIGCGCQTGLENSEKITMPAYNRTIPTNYSVPPASRRLSAAATWITERRHSQLQVGPVYILYIYTASFQEHRGPEA